MDMRVVNKEIRVGEIRVIAVASSSLLLVGDTEIVTLSSIMDAPPEAVTVGPIVPLAAISSGT